MKERKQKRTQRKKKERKKLDVILLQPHVTFKKIELKLEEWRWFRMELW